MRILESIYPGEARLSTETVAAGGAGGTSRYGALELQSLYARFLFRGLGIAVAA